MIPIIYSKDIEDNVLGCILIDKELGRYIKEISSEDFFDKANKEVFLAIDEINKENKIVDIFTTKEKMTKKHDANNILKYLVGLTDKVITTSNFKQYLNILKNYSIRRKISSLCQEIILKMEKYDSSELSSDIKKEIVKKFMELKINDSKYETEDMSKIISLALEDIENKYKKRDDLSYRTGIFDLDRITNGLHEQELTIIAARPGVGKTSFALQIAENIAKKGIYTYFATLEMSNRQIASRMIARKANIDSHKLRSGWLEEEDFNKINNTIKDLIDIKMYLDSKAITVQEIEEKAYQLKEEKKLGLIIIDYLQLLKSKNKNNVREQEVAEISRRLKILSKDLDIPVIALCQLNRETEKRKRPILADLRESGSLEQDADNVIFLYSDDEERIKSNVIDVSIILAKQRNGPTGEIKVRFNKKTMSFINYVS